MLSVNNFTVVPRSLLRAGHPAWRTEMRDNIELPGRGYDTRDVETMARALAAAEGSGSNGKLMTVVVLCAAVVAVVLFVVVR